MGSDGNQNPWAPYYANYKDCSLGICSIYCPQFCYLILPPPPPDTGSSPFSSLIIAIIGVLATGFLLVSYYTIVTRYCKRRSNLLNNTLTDQENHEGMNHDQYFASGGLDEGIIKAITVCKYVKGDGLIEGSECAVCLSEFQENESLRLLPKCDHAFHLPCIDTWLKSHSNCPLCRACVVSLDKLVPNSQSSSVLNVDSHGITRTDELILVVDDQESIFDERIVLCENTDDLEIKQENMWNDLEGVKKFRRSVSLDTFSSKCQFLISDILQSNEDLQVGSDKSMKGIGSSNGLLLKSPVAMKRSVSTGRFNDKGKNPILRN